MRRSDHIDEAYAYCRRVAHKHGANFSVGFRFLPRAKRRAVYAAYAFCRHADDIADDPGEGIAERLDAWQEELENCYRGSPRTKVTIALADALTRFPIPKDAFIALLDGCRQDLVKHRYATFDELLHYCDLVATSISDISLPIFGYAGSHTPAYGRNLSTGLQLTNIIRDVGDDLERDRIYLPAEDLERFGVSERELLDRVESERMRALLFYQIERAESYFRAAAPLLSALSASSRFPTKLMGSIYCTVLGELKKDPFKALGPRISLSTPRKMSVVLNRIFRPAFL